MKFEDSHSGRSASSLAKPTHEQISSRAEVLWDARGRPSGQDEAIWLEAERQLYEENKESYSGTEAEVSTPRSSLEAGSRETSSNVSEPAKPTTKETMAAKKTKGSSSRVKRAG